MMSSELATGKKAAAVKAVNDYVQVGTSLNLAINFNNNCAGFCYLEQSEAWNWKWKYNCICSGEIR